MLSLRRFNWTILLCALCTVSGCAGLWPGDTVRERHVSSSLVDFLYPDGVAVPAETSVARLELPLRVGIGFVPGDAYASSLTEDARLELLLAIKSRFSNLDYVHDIVVVPQTYLRGRRGLLAVEQIGRLHQLDVIGLVSYDQTTISEARKSSLLYWTILGAYVVKGSSNEVSTFMDLAVLDVRSQKLLLRAGGVHRARENSTLVDRQTVSRISERKGFDHATQDLMENFSVELERFESALADNPKIDVVTSSRGGGGAVLPELLMLIVLLGLRYMCRRCKAQRCAAKCLQRLSFGQGEC